MMGDGPDIGFLERGLGTHPTIMGKRSGGGDLGETREGSDGPGLWGGGGPHKMVTKMSPYNHFDHKGEGSEELRGNAI